MYVGHFAIGMALKAHKPAIPAFPILLGVGFLDILDGVFVILGWDRVAALAGIASFSHFLADWPMHNNDLALFPYAEYHPGMGLWGKLGIGAWVLEGVFAAALLVYAFRSLRERGVDVTWPCVVLGVLFLQLPPWLSPMKVVATFSEPAAHLAHGALVAIGFLVPGLILTALITRAEGKART